MSEEAPKGASSFNRLEEGDGVADLSAHPDPIINVAVTRQKSSEAEAEEYAVAVASALAEILVEVLNPLYRSHPDLAPEGNTVPRLPKPKLMS